MVGITIACQTVTEHHSQYLQLKNLDPLSELMAHISLNRNCSPEQHKFRVENYYLPLSRHAKSQDNERKHLEPHVMSLSYAGLNNQEGNWLIVLPNVTTKDSNFIG